MVLTQMGRVLCCTRAKSLSLFHPDKQTDKRYFRIQQGIIPLVLLVTNIPHAQGQNCACPQHPHLVSQKGTACKI